MQKMPVKIGNWIKCFVARCSHSEMVGREAGNVAANVPAYYTKYMILPKWQIEFVSRCTSCCRFLHGFSLVARIICCDGCRWWAQPIQLSLSTSPAQPLSFSFAHSGGRGKITMHTQRALTPHTWRRRLCFIGSAKIIYYLLMMNFMKIF